MPVNVPLALDCSTAPTGSAIWPWDLQTEIGTWHLSLSFSDDKSTLVQIMAWCHQAPSHYLNQCWPRSVMPYGVTRPQWVKKWKWNWTQPNCLHSGRNPTRKVNSLALSFCTRLWLSAVRVRVWNSLPWQGLVLMHIRPLAIFAIKSRAHAIFSFNAIVIHLYNRK